AHQPHPHGHPAHPAAPLPSGHARVRRACAQWPVPRAALRRGGYVCHIAAGKAVVEVRPAAPHGALAHPGQPRGDPRGAAAPPDGKGRVMRTEVSDWLRRRTYRASTYSAARLFEAKRADDCTVSVVLPARNEEATVGTIVEAVRDAFVEHVALVDDL